MIFSALSGMAIYYPVNTVCLGMKGIVAEFVLHKQKNGNATSKANSQPQDVDKRKYFVSGKVAQGNSNIVF